jgi:coronin-7
MLYREAPLTVLLDVSPSSLIPYYDTDTKVLMLVGRGESTVLFYDLKNDPVFLNKQSFSSITLGISILPKFTVDVKNVEIIKGYRMNATGVEMISVTVPRIKKEYFQDDIYCPSVDFLSSCIPVKDFIGGSVPTLVKKDLKPLEMTCLSAIEVHAAVKKPMPSFEQVISEQERKDASLKTMFATAINESDGPLKQDLMEGVDEEEW